jgi:hypothetical protein
MRDQKFDPGLKIRPPLLQNLPRTGISRFNQLAYGEVDLSPCRFGGAHHHVLHSR